MGAKLIYEVSNKTNDIAGDGTTTAAVLAQAMIHRGLEAVEKALIQFSCVKVLNLQQKSSEEIIRKIPKVETNNDIASVATISSGSAEIGEIIAKAMEKVGRDGIITVDESQGFDTELEVVEGMQYDKGYVSPYMVTDREKWK